MHLTTITTIALTMLVCGSSGQALRRVQRAVGVSGSAQGFGRGTTGGSGGRTVTPNNNAELVNYLTSKETLTIVLTKTFDFTGTEGRTTATGCAPWGTGAGCQLAINANNWCSSTAQKVQVNYDNAGTNPINMGSNKSVVGSGKNGVIKGKGLRMANGVQNVILQNFMITGLNPQYVWGGDAITLDGSDKIWIDHVTTSLIGRQHIVSGYNANTGVTISNCDIDGNTDWSASCDGHHYWALYFTGKNDQITLQSNYIRNTSGRSPKIENGAVVHAVNNYWYANSGHALEGEQGFALVEGSVFQNVDDPQDSKSTLSIFASTSSTSVCRNTLGRNCEANIFGSSGPLSEGDTAVLSKLAGKGAAGATVATVAQKSVPASAGYGKI